MPIPKFVALCGSPTSGKTEIAEILRDKYGGVIVDDGYCLRQAVMALYGLSWSDVNTQQGKAGLVTVCGKEYTVRQLLGDLGKRQELEHGAQFMPERAIASIAHASDSFYIFPSCRMNQGLTYLNAGGIVVEVTRPGAVPYYEFDKYDSSLVTFTIANDDTSDEWRKVLESRVAAQFNQYIS